MNVLNIIPDEKFAPFLQDVFASACPGASRFVVYGVRQGGPRYAKKMSHTKFVSKGYWASGEFRKDVSCCSVAFFHSLTPAAALVIPQIPRKVRVIWRGWGGDYYNLLSKVTGSLVLPKTKEVWRNSGTRSVAESLGVIKDFRNYLIYKARIKAVLDRVNLFSCCVPQDFDRLKNALEWEKVKYIQQNYYSVERSFVGCDSVSGEDILLGNSATPENNHVEVLEWLRDIDLGERKVIVPLSYGNARYRDEVLMLGKRWLGKSFFPLVDYMRIEEYNKISSRCSIVIMNHVRQQAMGNIAASLFRGAKVVLRQENPIHEFYRAMGGVIDTLDSGGGGGSLMQSLDGGHSKKNREIVQRYWSHDVAIENAKNVVLCR